MLCLVTGAITQAKLLCYMHAAQFDHGFVCMHVNCAQHSTALQMPTTSTLNAARTTTASINGGLELFWGGMLSTHTSRMGVRHTNFPSMAVTCCVTGMKNEKLLSVAVSLQTRLDQLVHAALCFRRLLAELCREGQTFPTLWSTTTTLPFVVL